MSTQPPDRPVPPPKTDDEGWNRAAKASRGEEPRISDADEWDAARSMSSMPGMGSDGAGEVPGAESAEAAESTEAAERAEAAANSAPPAAGGAQTAAGAQTAGGKQVTSEAHPLRRAGDPAPGAPAPETARADTAVDSASPAPPPDAGIGAEAGTAADTEAGTAADTEAGTAADTEAGTAPDTATAAAADNTPDTAAAATPGATSDTTIDRTSEEPPDSQPDGSPSPTSGASSFPDEPPAPTRAAGKRAAAKDDARRKADDDLREAVGLGSSSAVKGRAGGSSLSPWQRRGVLALAGIALVAALVATLWFLGRRNSRTYAIQCEATRITAEQGRWFPPWGRSRLQGPAWQPIPLPANSECESRLVSTREDLIQAYRAALITRSEAWIVALAPEPAAPGPGSGDEQHPSHERLDQVQTQLEQALMLSRAPADAELRARIERLLGDLDYWRARHALDAVRTDLEAAAKRFREAGQRNPRHAHDVADWQRLTERVHHELEQGPSAVPAGAPAGPSGMSSTTGAAGVPATASVPATAGNMDAMATAGGDTAAVAGSADGAGAENGSPGDGSVTADSAGGGSAAADSAATGSAATGSAATGSADDGSTAADGATGDSTAPEPASPSGDTTGSQPGAAPEPTQPAPTPAAGARRGRGNLI